jgi:hypothetical protein
VPVVTLRSAKADCPVGTTSSGHTSEHWRRRGKPASRGWIGGTVRPVSSYEWDPDTYLRTMHEEIPGYEELQDAVASASTGRDARQAGSSIDGLSFCFACGRVANIVDAVHA